MSKFPSVNYIGNKNKIVSWIIKNLPDDIESVVDLFSGGSSVSYAFKENGFLVYSNDMLYANYLLSKSIVENKDVTLDEKILSKVINGKLFAIKRDEINFLENKFYFDYEVDELAKMLCIADTLNGYKKAFFLSLLRRAMVRKMPYSRMNIKWEEIVKLRDEEYSYEKYGRKRAYHNETFEFHIRSNMDSYNNSVFDNGKENKSYNKDAVNMLKGLKNNVDLIYLDPPYPGTMNNYCDFYGICDRVFGKEMIESIDLTKKTTFLDNFAEIIKECYKKSKYIAISINSNCNPSSSEITNMLEEQGYQCTELKKKHDYKITGKENKSKNFEILLIGKKLT